MDDEENRDLDLGFPATARVVAERKGKGIPLIWMGVLVGLS